MAFFCCTLIISSRASSTSNIFLDVVDAFQDYVGNKLPLVEEEIQQAEDEIKLYKGVLNNMNDFYQQAEVGVFHSMRKIISQLQLKQSDLTERLRKYRNTEVSKVK